jgi:hypothetical protein
MFDTICIKPNSHSFPTDVGFIAENLIYYKHVVIVADSNTIPILLNNCDVGILQELLSEKSLRLCIRENLLAVRSETSPEGLIFNDVDSISSDRLKVEQVLFDGIFQATGRRGHSKRLVQKLLPLVEPIEYEQNICDMVRNDLSEQSYTKATILDTIKFYNSEIDILLDDIEYRWLKTDRGYLFETNLNYEEINRLIPNNPDGKIINSTGLILNILETRGDMHPSHAVSLSRPCAAAGHGCVDSSFVYQYITIDM